MATVLETPHAIIGAAIATKVVNPLVAVPLAFGSHFLLDMVPHWNPHILTELKRDGKVSTKSKIIIAADVSVAFISGTIIAVNYLPDTGRFLTVMACAFAGVLPDLIEGPYFFLRSRNAVVKKWLQFQKFIQVDADNWAGMITQVAVCVAAIWWIAGGI